MAAARDAAAATTVVVDVGGHSLKAGYGAAFPGEEGPSVVLSTTLADTDDPAAPPRRAVVDGRVADWDALEALLHETLYNRIGWPAGEEGGLLWADPILTPRRDRERLAQVAFETFNLSGFYAADAPVLALYAAGRLSGTVVDIGHDKIDVAAVVDGAVVAPATRRVGGAGGAAADAALAAALAARGALPPGTPLASVRAAKQALLSAKPGASVDARLPDGTTITLVPADAAAARAALLTPPPASPPPPSVPEAVALCVGAAPDAAARRTALEGLLVCGGGAGASGVPDDLAAAVGAAVAHLGAPPLIPVPDYMPGGTLGAAAWCGAAVLSRVVFGAGQQLTKAEYDEHGPSVVHKKCTP